MTGQPLSYAQEELWVGHHLSTRPDAHDLPITVRLHGRLDERRLADALTALAVRHPVLRTRVILTPAGPRQSTVPAAAVALAPDRTGEPLDLAAGDVLRARLRRVGADEHVLSISTHRVCLDEDSVPGLLAELFAAYRGEPVTGPPFRFADYAAEERRSRCGPALEPHLAYWAGLLDGASPLALAACRQRPRRPAGRAGRATLRIAAHIEEVRAAALAVLGAYCGQQDIVVGTSRSLRRGPGSPGWLGPFTEPVPVRIDLSGDPAFGTAVRRCAEAFDAADRHGEAPLGAVRRHLGGHVPPMAVTIGIGGPAPVLPQMPGLAIEPADPAPYIGTADLALVVTESADGVQLRADYNEELFDRSRIERLLRHVEVFAGAGVADPGRPLSRLPLLTGAERAEVLAGWQGPVVPYPREPVHRQVSAHARRDPGAVALRHQGAEMSYGELDRRARMLARRLRAEGVGRDDIVAVCLDRGFEVVVAMLGILQAGGAFAILDPAHPPQRSAFLLADTATRVVITSSDLRDRLPATADATVIRLDADWPAIERQPDSELLAEVADEHSLAYVLYTSGSTGRPKGALIEHGSLSNFVLWPRWLFGLGPHDRMVQHMALVFDFAEGEIFTALTCGAALVLLPDRVRTSPEALGRLIAEERITCVFGPPAVLNNVELQPCPDLRYVVVGGDVCTGDLVTRWNTPGRRFVNGYGPTEATVGCTAYECEHRRWQSPPPIGRAMPNRLTYILDAAMRPCPVGVVGELYIGGAGLARGYLNRPDLTRERFLADPFRPGHRIYRTGDLCMWSEDGQILFLGRADTQVKVNGLRVELEEIEAALTAQPGVHRAAVLAYRDGAGPTRLIAHVVTATGTVDGEALRGRLAETLPANLVPGQYLSLERLPLTNVGKVDRAALAALHHRDDPAAGRFQPPRTPAEQQVATLVGNILGSGANAVGVHESLLEASADPLLDLIRVTAAVNEAFGLTLTAPDVSEEPTVAGIARLVERVHGEAEAAAQDLLDEVERMSGEEVSRLTAGPGPA
ncbi:non-ribosomal peptide synthetase [Paractinoplanes rishiriensis]|uniref:Amino acid adenylation domain-containing protein n=1 Tax=Paractinoplanes rishiriensis TaxID=1050105 RepID=A0A919MY79_9ACTN|nr:non-ribosomal peptide synthetase [Actinoplanes rishiriensis]GIE99534.1 hypothetical protein Ari01nite_69990 [Actinoplanes rishiriensis]